MKLAALVIFSCLPLVQFVTRPVYSQPTQSNSAGHSTATGTIRFHQLSSAIFSNERTLRVLLPEGYNDPKNRNRRYPILYLNDGQNVFDVRTSLFNPMEWRADETVLELIRKGAIEPMIVVGIDNAGRRMRFNEYFPYEDEYLRPPLPSPQGKRYPDFLTEEVLPLINRLYRTKTGRESTGIGGSSAGAVAALLAVIQKPSVFGLLLMESPSLYISNAQLIKDSEGLRPVRAYLGVGTNEGNRPDCRRGDRSEEAVTDVLRLQRVLERSGMDELSLKVVVEDCSTHNEDAWSKRLPTAIEFLYGRRASSSNSMFTQWSHDGKRIVDTSDRDGGSGRADDAIRRSLGTNRKGS